MPLTVGSDFTLNEETGKYVLTIKNVTPGGYTVKETTVQPDGTVMTVSYKVGDGEEQTGSEAEAEVTKNQKTTVEFSDEIREAGTLELTKTIEGDLTLAEIEGDLTFVVTTTVGEGEGAKTKYLAKDGSLSDDKVVLTVGKDFTYNEETDKYVLTIENVLPGGYTVEEITVQPDGTVMTVTYKVGDGEETEGTEAQASVTKGEKTAVEFSDAFEATTGILELTKTIEGDLTAEEIAGDLTFIVTTKVEEGGEEKTKYLGKDGELHDDEQTLTVGEDFTYNEETDKYVLTIKNVEPGGYTVTETTIQPDGTKTTVTYSVNTVSTAARRPKAARPQPK